MIYGVFIVNNQGQGRLVKVYTAMDEKLQQLTLRQAYNIVSNRDDSLCNFLEVTTLTAFKEKGVKIVYRTYATLHIIFIVDSCESVLGVLDLIQVFVETLDTSFSNVCELDLQFHLDKVHHILNEVVLGGIVLDTNKSNIGDAIKGMQQAELRDVNGVSTATASTPSDIFSSITSLFGRS